MRRSSENGKPLTIVEKILQAHTIIDDGERALVYVDRLVIADTALPAMQALEKSGYRVMRPSQSILIPDHFTPTSGPTLEHVVDEERRALIREGIEKAKQLGIATLGLGDPRRGIQHVVAVEQAYAQPGLCVVAADSHTSTQGAIGALAFSIGTDLGHVLATQCVWLKKPAMMRIRLEGKPSPNVTAKDIVMAVIATLGSRGATGFAVEYAGSFIRNLSIDGRMTISNMSVEMGARMGIVSPDQITFDYLRGRPLSPVEHDWDDATTYWKSLVSDEGACFERDLVFDVSHVEPMVTWGNNTENAIPISGRVPDPSEEQDPERKAQMQKSLDYMGLEPLTRAQDISVDQVFIGSCVNSTLEDIRAAAYVLRGREVVVPTLVVPGSGRVKALAEAEGLDRIFLSAGAQWGEAGCSMCSAMNGDSVPAGWRCASTTNRNHMGRQGRGSRTHLVSPLTAAAAAFTGRLVDVRNLRES
jgi:3-isopropylmalate/(R)-2-methylmalate dehydratase large subunit